MHEYGINITEKIKRFNIKLKLKVKPEINYCNNVIIWNL